MEMTPVTVQRKWLAAEGIAAFQLSNADRSRMPAFTPGAHVAVRIVTSTGETLLRTYSLCNGPHDLDSYVLGVKLEPASRGGSHAMHTLVNEGDTLEISGPINNFPLVETADFHLLLGGGIGITPLLAMAQHLHAERKQFALHYFVRGIEHLAFRERLRGMEDSGQVHFHVGLTGPEVQEQLRGLLAAPATGCHAYACGPAPFMDTVQQIGALAEWDSQGLHFEHFQGPVNAIERTGDTQFELHLVRSGLHCTVGKDETILTALTRVGIVSETSCEQGVCGTCLTRVLGGKPDHRDLYLSDAEHAANDQMLICVGRSLTPVLELDL